MGKLISEFREPNRKDEVTRLPFVLYARQLALLVNTLGSHLKWSYMFGKLLLLKTKLQNRELKFTFNQPKLETF